MSSKAQELSSRDLRSYRFIGDFMVGDRYPHGAVQITPMRNREYIGKFRDALVLGANPALAERLGYRDPDAKEKKERYNIAPTALVSQGFLFHAGFGLSVHDISFKASANLAYADLRYGVPVFEGDVIYGMSEVLGKEYRKDGATNGSVQVKTTTTNQRGEIVLEYVRQVLVPAEKGLTYNKESSIKPQPKTITVDPAKLPRVCSDLPRELLGEHGKTFEEFEEGKIYEGTWEDGIDLVTASWLQIATQNDAAVHHMPEAEYIVYGGAIKAMAEGQVSAHLSLAYHLGMNSGSHDAPTYPKNVIRRRHAEGKEGKHDTLRSRFEVTEKKGIEGREDIGVVTIRLIADKIVTDAGVKALEAARFGGMDRIREVGGERLLQVLRMDQVLAVPTEKAFA